MIERVRALRDSRLVYAAGPLWVLALNALIALHGRLHPGDVYYGSGFFYDSQFYVGMSQRPVSLPMTCVGPPYCWRPLAPLVAHLLPGPPGVTFVVLTVTCLALTCLAVSWLLRCAGLDRGTAAWGGMAFATLGPATGVTLFDVARVDPLAFLLLALVVGATLRRRRGLAAGMLILLAFAKETALVGVVFQLRKALRERGPYGWVLLGSAGVVAALVIVRLEVRLPPGVHNPFFDQVGTVTHYTIFPPRAVPRLLSATVGTWGFLAPLAALQLVHPPRTWRKPEFVYLLAIATAQIFVSGDVQRVVVYGFPAIILAAAAEVDYLCRRLAWRPWTIWLPLLAAQAVWSIPADLGASVSPPESLTSEPLTIALDLVLALATIAGVVGLRGLAKPGPPSTGAPQPTSP